MKRHARNASFSLAKVKSVRLQGQAQGRSQVTVEFHFFAAVSMIKLEFNELRSPRCGFRINKSWGQRVGRSGFRWLSP